MTRHFARTTEDFECLVCGAAVRGDGYTNHCPGCLWSRHVDVHPGDRAADCRGLMRPVAVEARSRDTMLTHRCERCGHQRRNRTSRQDDADALRALAAAVAEAAVAEAAVVGTVRGTGRGSDAPRRRGRPR